MKLRSLLLLSVLAIPLTACTNPANVTQPPAALAPGYATVQDQQIGQAIQGATGFYTAIQNDVSAGKYTPTPAELTGLNAFGRALNAAKALAQTYHNNPTAANLAPAQNAVNGLQAQQAALKAQIGSK